MPAKKKSTVLTLAVLKERYGRYGQASIRQDADGRYRATVEMASHGGKRVRQTVSSFDLIDFEAKIQALLAERDNPQPKDAYTVESWAKEWMETLIRPNGRVNKVTSYSSICALYICPRLGSLNLADVRRYHVRDLFEYLKGKGLAYSTRKSIRSVLSKLFSDAVERSERTGLEVNPAQGFKLEEAPTSDEEPEHFSAEEMATFLESAKDSPHFAYWHLVFQWGFRPAELLGLTYGKIVLDGPEPAIKVHADLVRPTGEELKRLKKATGNGFKLEATKSGSSKRLVYLTAEDVSVIRQHRAKQELRLGQRFDPEGFVFSTRLGSPVHIRDLRREFHSIRESAELPNIRLYAGRHSGLRNLLIETGGNFEATRAVAGHKDDSILRKHYANIDRELRRSALALRLRSRASAS